MLRRPRRRLRPKRRPQRAEAVAGRASKRLCVGVFSGAHGVRGDVRLKSFTQNPLDIAAYGPLTGEDGTRRFEILKVRPTRDHLVATVKGIASREDALALKGTRLYVERARLPAPDETDTWYHADLIGLEARDADGALMGTVKAVFDYGAGDLLEIALEGSGKLVLIPFTAETVPEVDIDGGQLTVLPPEGLID